ncbi:hypothetical protein BCT19_04115 [Vibrio splendidus]|uniref:hypothetical protein n=1 Tax=Vibrio splendidus TaxID=29497 RepID=UPI000C841DF9|nr:hypothetical protein [Vibrio splendidus]PMN99859.1 hypothetical protein BCT19_04115 [Vibrio splendidus]
MDKFFDGKHKEVEAQGDIKAFGIIINSRYGKFEEICEMLKFSKELADKGLHIYIESILYDSKGHMCTFEFHSEFRSRFNAPIEEQCHEGREIFQCAINCISHFILFDCEYA